MLRGRIVAVKDVPVEKLNLPADMAAKIRDSQKNAPAKFKATIAKLTNLAPNAVWQNLETRAPRCIRSPASVCASGALFRPTWRTWWRHCETKDDHAARACAVNSQTLAAKRPAVPSASMTRRCSIPCLSVKSRSSRSATRRTARSICPGVSARLRSDAAVRASAQETGGMSIPCTTAQINQDNQRWRISGRAEFYQSLNRLSCRRTAA